MIRVGTSVSFWQISYILIGYPKSLHEFTYQDSEINNVILSCMSNISITGIVGGISFGDGADPIKNVKIERIQGKRRLVTWPLCIYGPCHAKPVQPDRQETVVGYLSSLQTTRYN